jgi:hypothetical protein
MSYLATRQHYSGRLGFAPAVGLILHDERAVKIQDGFDTKVLDAAF